MMAKKMTPAQRRQHYNDWLASGMSKSAYARLHGINTKTFWHLCRQLSADVSAATAPALLPATLAVIIRELNLC